jgi:thiol-disulfide isomerase/thioredoxin
MVHVWATWCRPCLEELPSLVKLRKEFSSDGFSLILVSTDDPDDADSLVVPALDSAGVGFGSYLYTGKSQDAFIRRLHPDWTGAMPASFIYDRTGRLAGWFYGERTYESYASEIDKLLHD